MIKIAIIGKIRSGKDSFAKVFIDHGYQEFKFGTGIAEVIQKYFPDDWAAGKPRRHYQHIGQELRHLDPQVWVNYCFRAVENSGADKVIITDVRQENEVKRLREAGYIIIKVEADEALRLERMRAAGDSIPDDDVQLFLMLNHETEQYADQVVPDIIVKNEGTLEFLRDNAWTVMHHIETIGGK